MIIDNAYYKKIIYKKNAFDDLKTYVKLNYSTKKIMLISETMVMSEDVTMVLNSLFVSSEKVTHFVFRRGCSILEKTALADKIKKDDFGLLVALGGGAVCEAVKYIAYLFKIPYIVCPTSATSLAYFTNYCFNPNLDGCSFYANMPSKIFIQESIIRNSNLRNNIAGISLLQSLRSVYAEGVVLADEKNKYIFLGMEKLFNKLDEEQNNILLCGDDSNLVLMDILIDFGFFMAMLNKNDYYLYNMYAVYGALLKNDVGSSCGEEMLLCTKLILSVLNEFLALKNINCIEKPKCNLIFKKAKKYLTKNNFFKDNEFLNKKMKNIIISGEFLKNLTNIKRVVLMQIYKINKFCESVKSVYRYGIEVEGDYQKLTEALAVVPYFYGDNELINILAGSGILNAYF